MKPLLALAMACVLTACASPQRVTLVAGNDPDAAACFEACAGSASCARACPGVTVEDGECQRRDPRACVSGSEVSGAKTTAVVVVLGTLATVGLMSLMFAALTPTI